MSNRENLYQNTLKQGGEAIQGPSGGGGLTARTMDVSGDAQTREAEPRRSAFPGWSLGTRTFFAMRLWKSTGFLSTRPCRRGGRPRRTVAWGRSPSLRGGRATGVLN